MFQKLRKIFQAHLFALRMQPRVYNTEEMAFLGRVRRVPEIQGWSDTLHEPEVHRWVVLLSYHWPQDLRLFYMIRCFRFLSFNEEAKSF